MRKLIIALCLFSRLAFAGVDPANYFVGYPWVNTNNVTSTWYQVESTNHIIKQLMLSMKDRCDRAGRPDLGDYQNYVQVWAGTKTNFSYTFTNKVVTVTNNVVYTNWIWCTNYPHLQLQYTNALLNTYSNFLYYYASDAGNPAATALISTGAVYVTGDMMRFLNTGIVQICRYYANIGTNGISNYFGTAPYPINNPRFNMATLSIAAGYTNNVTGITYDAGGRPLSGNWHWQTELPSNGVMTLAALDERAAYIAQLNTVIIGSKACTPARYRESKAHASSDDITQNYTSYAEFENKKSYSWIQQEVTDVPTSVVSNFNDAASASSTWKINSWTDAHARLNPDRWNEVDIGTNNWKTIVSGYRVNNPPDWPYLGWKIDYGVNAAFDISRPDTNHPSWMITSSDDLAHFDSGWYPFGVLPWYFALVSSNISESISKTPLTAFEWTPYEIQIKVASLYTGAVYNAVTRYFPSGNPFQVADGVATNGTSNIVSAVATNLLIQTNATGDIICRGNYQTLTNENTAWFTNTFSGMSNRITVYTNFVSYVYTNFSGFSVSNKYTMADDSITYNGSWTNEGTNALGAETNSGTFSFTSPYYNYGEVWKRSEVYSYRPDINKLYTNAATTAQVWLIGGKVSYGATYDFVSNPTDWTRDTYASYRNGNYAYQHEWAEDVYSGSTTQGYHWVVDTNHIGVNFYTNRYVNLTNINVLSEMTTNGMIYYTNFYYSAVVQDPWQSSADSRAFWGMADLVFLIEFAFTNHF